MKDEKVPSATLLGEAPARSIFIWCYAKSPSVNEWNNKKHHRWIYASKRKEWELRLLIALRSLREIRFDKVSIDVKRYSIRMLDEANAADGLKPIIDCLTERHKGIGGIGIFKDDSRRYMPHAPRIEQIKVDKESAEKTVIVIKEIE